MLPLNVLVVDTTKPDWWAKLGTAAGYESITSPNSPRPEALRGSYQADCELLDGCLGPDGLPRYALRDLLLHVGPGVLHERYSASAGEYLRTMLLPECKRAETVMTDDGTCWAVGQAEPGGPLLAAQLPGTAPSLPAIRANDFLLATRGTRPMLLYRTEGPSAGFSALELTDRQWRRCELPKGLQDARAVGLVCRPKRRCLLALGDGKSSLYRLSDDGYGESVAGPAIPVGLQWRYEGCLPGWATNCGIFRQSASELEFTTITSMP